MRFNCHTHVFNAKSVFARHTLDILLNRITEWDLPDFVKKALTDQVKNILGKAGEYVDEEKLFRNLLRKISTSRDFKGILEHLSPADSLRVAISGGDALEDYAVEGLVDLLGRMGNALDQGDKDAAETDLKDAIAFLRIALLPSVRHVTEHLMEQLTSKDAVIALMMDITKDGRDRELFEKQLADTSQMVLAYPGRFFPFVAVNSRRPDHFTIMERALTGMGFVGVKLYPSLGYEIDSEEMYKVYAYCEERDVPLLMHCNEGGFYYQDKTRSHSDPKRWKPILRKHSNLKICFGHFGGGQYLAKQRIPSDSWTRTVLDLMEQHEGVYGDISSHTEPMKGGDAQKWYFENLSGLLNDARFRDRILFGTDYFLVRQRLKEKHHWRYFCKHLSETEFRRMAEQNPPDFLGLPKENRHPAWGVRNYVNFIYQHRDALQTTAPAWLKAQVKDQFGASATLPKPSLGALWSWNNKAHAFLYVFLAEGQLGQRAKEKGFAAAGMFKLRELAYWNKGFEPKEIWERKRKAMAENLDSFYRTNGATFEEKFNVKKALQVFENAFNDGTKRVYELGELCDRIYRY